MRAEEPRWRRYLRLWGADARRDSDDELSFHFHAHVEDLVRQGMRREDAEVEARTVFGNIDSIRAELHGLGARRDARLARGESMALLLGDLRIAVRTLCRRPAYAAAAVLTLAVGVGAAAAVFSVLDGILLRPLPYPDAEQLVVLWERNAVRGAERNVVSVPAFEMWREQTSSYEALAALVPHRSTLTDRSPERIAGAEVSPEWFSVVGVQPRIGRGFTESDARQEPRPVVLSDGLWRDRFGADESIVGRVVSFGDDRYRVTAIMPADFQPPSFGWLAAGQRYWIPFLPDEDNRSWGRFLLVLGRLRAGASVAAADVELGRVAAGPGVFDDNDQWTADVVGLRTDVTGGMRAQGLAIAIAVGLLLLISVANVASIVLMRARGRADELRMRIALGASRLGLVRQLLTESAAIALFSLPLSVLLAMAGVSAARRLLPPELPRLGDVNVTWQALAVCGLVLVLATVIIGLAPLLGRQGTARVAGSGQRVVRGRPAVLPAFELALALTLTTAAVLATRSLIHAQRVDPGYEPSHLVAARVSLTADDASEEARALAAKQLESELGAETAIASAGLVSYRPLSTGNPVTGVSESGSDAEPIVTDVIVATRGYFDAARIDLLHGRFFGDEAAAAPLPIVISQTLSRQLGSGNVLGRRLTIRLFDPFLEGTVVGVVADVRLGGPLVEPRATVYIDHREWPVNTVDVVARAATSTALATGAIRSAVSRLDSRLAVWDQGEMVTALHAATARERSLASMLGLFTVLALLLAAGGMYAAASVRAVARRREFGVRMALGATPKLLAGNVLRETLRTALPGVLAGTLLVLGGSSLLRRVLFGIDSADPGTLAATAVALVAIALLASAVPAWRASRTEPSQALRSD